MELSGIIQIEKRELSRPRLIISSLLFVFGMLLVLAPFLEPAGTVNFGENGIVGRFEHSQDIVHMQNPVSKLIYTFGDWECHQHASRSYFLNGNQMPVCARCTGIFVSMSVFAMLFVFFRVKMPFWRIIALIMPLALDGVVQLMSSYESSNIMRLITGILAGFATVTAFDGIIED